MQTLLSRPEISVFATVYFSGNVLVVTKVTKLLPANVHIANIFGFAGQMVFVTTSQLCLLL